MRLLFTFAGGSGHFLPAIPIARAALARGNTVAFSAQEMMLGAMEAAGFPAISSGGCTLADAMRSGATTSGSHDLLDLEWFAVADRPITVIRAEIGVLPKSAEAVNAGSVGPWQIGGITEFQLCAARQSASNDGHDDLSWTPDPATR